MAVEARGKSRQFVIARHVHSMLPSIRASIDAVNRRDNEGVGMSTCSSRMWLLVWFGALSCATFVGHSAAAVGRTSPHHRGRRSSDHAGVAGRHHRSKAGRSYHNDKLKITYVREEGSLHLAHKAGGSAIVEEGSASGTYTAQLQIKLTIRAHFTGSLVARLRGGTIYGHAVSIPHVSSRFASFKGSLTITGGTGRYAGAKGTAGFYGVLDRADFKMKVQLVGKLKM